MTTWVSKLQIECTDEEDGSMTIQIEWDETDPDLQYWTSLGSENQKQFIIDTLTTAIDCYVD